MLSTGPSMVLDDVLHIIIREEPRFTGGPYLYSDLLPSFGIGRHSRK